MTDKTDSIGTSEAHLPAFVTDRRAFLAAAPALALVTAGPAAARISPDATAWDAAQRRLAAAANEYKVYEENVHEPAYRRQLAFEEANGAKFGEPDWLAKRDALGAIHGTGYRVPAHISDETERLCEAWNEAETTLMQMPAPHLQALRWKLDVAFEMGERDEYTSSWEKTYLQQTIADYQRLLGGPA